MGPDGNVLICYWQRCVFSPQRFACDRLWGLPFKHDCLVGSTNHMQREWPLTNLIHHIKEVYHSTKGKSLNCGSERREAVLLVHNDTSTRKRSHACLSHNPLKHWNKLGRVVELATTILLARQISLIISHIVWVQTLRWKSSTLHNVLRLC